MPKRVVDGDALWRSKKLKAVRSEFRAEYANLIPLAEANGVFDADPESVWSDVYSFNRPEISTKIVVKILDEFEKVGLLHRWEQDGKVWGYWNGIEKPGRLPAKSLVDRGDVHMPTPNPPHVVPKGTTSLGLGFGLGKGVGKGWADKPARVFREISEIGVNVLGVLTTVYPKDQKDLRDLIKSRGAEPVLTAFKAFCESKAGETINYPVSAFLKSSGAFLGGVLAKVTTPELQNLGATLYEIGNQPFAGHDLYALNSLRENYSDEEIIGAYREFVSGQDDFQMKRAAKTFAGAGEAILLARRKRAEEDRRGEEFAEKASSILRKKAEEEEKTLDEDKFAPSF